MHSLMLVYNDTSGIRREVKLIEERRDEWTVGRVDQAIVLDHDSVSRNHARIFWAKGQWMVEDMGSRNGTFINQQRVNSPSVIAGGDRLRFGRVPVEVQTMERDDGVKPIEVLQIAYEARKQEIKKLQKQLERARAERADLDDELSFLRHENEMLREQINTFGGLKQWNEPVDNRQTMQEPHMPAPAMHAPAPQTTLQSHSHPQGGSELPATHHNLHVPQTGDFDVHAKLDRMMAMLERLLGAR